MARELDHLKTAILNEVEGYNFYKAAAGRAQDPDMREAFLRLAEDELKHESWLRQLYEDIRKKQQVSIYNTDDYFRMPGIFSRKNVPEADTEEFPVYRIGILLEEASARFYREAAAEADVPEVKQLLGRLATWEDTHQHALETKYEEYKQRWFRQQGMAE